MAELTIDLTYGTALFEAAQETGQKKRIIEEATEVLGIFKQEPDLYAFLNYPAISAEEKKKVIEKIFEGNICSELINFMYVLIDKRRIGHFERMIKVYRKLIEQEEGISYGTVYSVEPLGESQIHQLEDETSKLLSSKVRLDNEIDPKLMGGVKIMVDGKIIDATVKHKFDDLKNRIKLNQGGIR